MAVTEQIPGRLDVIVKNGDDWTKLVDSSIDQTGYTFVANIVHATTGALTAFTVTEVDLSVGQIRLTITDEAITALGVGVHSWYLQGTVGGLKRRWIEGYWQVVE